MCETALGCLEAQRTAWEVCFWTLKIGLALEVVVLDEGQVGVTFCNTFHW